MGYLNINYSKDKPSGFDIDTDNPMDLVVAITDCMSYSDSLNSIIRASVVLKDELDSKRKFNNNNNNSKNEKI